MNEITRNTFRKFTATLDSMKYATAFHVVIELNQFKLVANRMSTQDFTTLRIERGFDSVGASVRNVHPACSDMWQVELDLFLQFAAEWHSANPVQEREKVSQSYLSQRRWFISELNKAAA